MKKKGSGKEPFPFVAEAEPVSYFLTKRKVLRSPAGVVATTK